jgi:hypothetical protein
VVPPAEETPVIVLGVEEAANPLPVAADAGQADTNGQLVAGGLTGFAAFLMSGTGLVLRLCRGHV